MNDCSESRAHAARSFGWLASWSGALIAAFACGCASPALSADAANPSPMLRQTAERICDRTMSFDVAGPYFAQCLNYLMAHGVAPGRPVAVSQAEPAEHRACEYAGFSQGTPAYASCVQQMYQLDISSTHL